MSSFQTPPQCINTTHPLQFPLLAPQAYGAFDAEFTQDNNTSTMSGMIYFDYINNRVRRDTLMSPLTGFVSDRRAFVSELYHSDIEMNGMTYRMNPYGECFAFYNNTILPRDFMTKNGRYIGVQEVRKRFAWAYQATTTFPSPRGDFNITLTFYLDPETMKLIRSKSEWFNGHETVDYHYFVEEPAPLLPDGKSVFDITDSYGRVHCPLVTTDPFMPPVLPNRSNLLLSLSFPLSSPHSPFFLFHSIAFFLCLIRFYGNSFYTVYNASWHILEEFRMLSIQDWNMQAFRADLSDDYADYPIVFVAGSNWTYTSWYNLTSSSMQCKLDQGRQILLAPNAFANFTYIRPVVLDKYVAYEFYSNNWWYDNAPHNGTVWAKTDSTPLLIVGTNQNSMRSFSIFYEEYGVLPDDWPLSPDAFAVPSACPAHS
jgi:hypothetical protein